MTKKRLKQPAGWSLVIAAVLIIAALFWANPWKSASPPVPPSQGDREQAEPSQSAPPGSSTPSGETASASPQQESPAPPEEDKAELIPGTERYQPMVRQGMVDTEAARGGTISYLPLYAIEASYGVDVKGNGEPPAVTLTAPLPNIAFGVPPELAESLAFYWMNSGDDKRGYMILAPDGWRSAGSAVGANSSFAFRLENPDNPLEALDYSDTAGGCKGCAIASIGAYFPDMAEWAAQQGFADLEQLDFISRETINNYFIRYSINDAASGALRHGIAFKQTAEGEDVTFMKLDIHVPDSQSSLRETIIRFFQENTGAYGTLSSQ